MCAEWHADGRGYFLWQPSLVVLWLCTTFPNIGQPTLYIANPQPCMNFSNMSAPLHFFPNTGQPTLYIAYPEPCVIVSNMSPPLHYFPNIGPFWPLHSCHLNLSQLLKTEICCGSSASHLAQVVPSAKQKRKDKEKTTPFGVNLMRSQILYRAAQTLCQAASKPYITP